MVDAPLLDQDLGFLQAVDQLSVLPFVPEPSIEAFATDIRSLGSWFDVGCFGLDSGDPVQHGLGDKL